MWGIKLTEEQLKILKNPHDNAELLTEDLFKSCGFDIIKYTDVDYIWLSNDTYSIYINLGEGFIKMDGLFNLWCEALSVDIFFLENLFEYPMLPSKEEKELFYIEHGLEYPIPVYEGEL